MGVKPFLWFHEWCRPSAGAKNSLDPDEVVGIAALHAESLFGNQAHQQHSLLLDVTPRALGVMVSGGYAELILNRNMPLPIEQSRVADERRQPKRGTGPNLPGRVPSL